MANLTTKQDKTQGKSTAKADKLRKIHDKAIIKYHADGLKNSEIKNRLNQDKITTSNGNSWSSTGVDQVLTRLKLTPNKPSKTVLDGASNLEPSITITDTVIAQTAIEIPVISNVVVTEDAEPTLILESAVNDAEIVTELPVAAVESVVDVIVASGAVNVPEVDNVLIPNDVDTLVAPIPRAKLTKFGNNNGSLNKTFNLCPLTGAIRKISCGQLYNGYADPIALSLSELKDVIENLTSNQALGIGVVKEEFKTLQRNSGYSLASRKFADLQKQIVRTKDYFEFNDGFSFVMCDYDGKDLNFEQLREILTTEIEPFANVGMLFVGSSSGGVYLASDEPPATIKGGCHIYLMVEKGTDTPAIAKYLNYKMWVAGYGHFEISKCGSLLERQLFDDYVFTPERLSFEAPATINDGVAVLPRRIELFDGGYVPAGIDWSLSDEQLQELAKLKQAERAKRQPAADLVKVQFKKSEVDRLVAEGFSKKDAEKIAENTCNKKLHSSYKLHSVIYGTVTVGEVLSDSAKFLNTAFLDPFDTPADSSNYRAYLMWIDSDNGKLSLKLHSFHYGKTLYDLIPSDKPIAEFNDILDGNNDYKKLDLLQYVDDDHILKRLTIEISKATHLPQSTAFMVGLGYFSGFSCVSHSVSYSSGGALPIGLYVVAEQPSGTGKSRAMDIFQEPFLEAITQKVEEIKADIKIAPVAKNDKETILDEQLKRLQSRFPVTNSTGDALEANLTDSNGFFNAASSEQGLFNSLLGLSYGDGKKANNNDVLLHGYDGGLVNCKRVSRKAYNGKAIGAVTLFAQQGSIDTVISESNGTGLSERFLCVSEPHALGTRDHIQKHFINQSVINEYYAKCGNVIEQVSSVDLIAFKHLPKLIIQDSDWEAIGVFYNKVEPLLVDGGKFSHITLRGAAGKLEQNIMKIAANLHLLSGNDSNVIASSHVTAAININADLLKGLYHLCGVKGIVGMKAEFESILKPFVKFDKPQTSRQIIQSRSCVAPFKEMSGNKSKAIVKALTEMVEQGILKFDAEAKVYILAK